MKNLLIVISGPSGSGKSEVIKRVLNEKSDIQRISTYTTRKPREGEVSGEQYNFISAKEYLKLLDSKQLIACSRIEDTYYGTPVLDEALNGDQNKDFIIDMGVSGGLEIKEKYPEAVMIYIIPETEEQLLKQRGNRGPTRQARGIKQIQDVLSSNKYEWLVKNGKIDETVKKVELIIGFVHKLRQMGLSEKEQKMYEILKKEMSINSPQNREFLTSFYQIREGDIEI